MKRITVYNENGDFAGWFDENSATLIASYRVDSGYGYGLRLLVTAGNKLIVNSWNICGMDVYRFATDENEIAEIIAREEDLEERIENLPMKTKSRIEEILKKYEI